MPTTLNNQATVSYTYTGAAAPNVTNSNITSTLLLDPYSLTATKTAVFGTFREGDRLTYLIPIQNTGTGPLYTVSVSDNLGGDAATDPMSYVADTAYLYADGVLTPITPTVTASGITFVLPNPLLPGADVLLVYGTSVSADLLDTVTAIDNTANVTARGGSVDGTLITADPAPSATVTREEYAALSVYKQADRSTVQVGDTLTYSFTLTNTGTADATGVTLTDTFPAGFSVTSVSLTQNGDTVVLPAGSYSVDAATNTLTVPVGTGTAISVPAMTGGVPGVTVVSVTGTIVA